MSTLYRSFLLIFLIFGLTLNFIQVQGLPDETTLYPTDDSYVSSVDRDNSYGELEELYASNRTLFGGVIRNSYLLFNLSSLPSEDIILSAKVNLYVVYIGSQIEVNVHYCADTNWHESNITYNNAPHFEMDPLSTVTINQIGESIFFNVTSTVLDAWDNDKIVTFVITSEERTNSADYVQFRSKEHEEFLLDSRPKLIIEHQSETPTTPFEVTLNTSPTFVGTITFKGNSYTHGSTITEQSGTYDINANPATNYTFSKWETEGNITVLNSNSASTKCTISGNGNLRMVQTESPSQSAHINFETEPTNSGEIGLDGSSYRSGSKTVKSTGSYIISANPDTGYNFSRWETSGSIMISNTNSISTTCNINGNGTIKMVLISSTPTPPQPSLCVIITALHGSSLNPEIDYMRHVRDDMIGSNVIGEKIVSGWNTFYYSWSPELSRLIAGSMYVKTIFRVLLIPLIAIIHSISIIYLVIASYNSGLASVLSFVFASILTSIVYIVLPFMMGLVIVRKIYSNRHQ